ncbi:MAG TPA: exodeoxyribonuclease VII small subunit [Longimicrobiales bacterium]|nr:exodeoxyribonuclease VII small subunit [Longimicrobiales bacterium]
MAEGAEERADGTGFEERLERLERIVRQLEAGELELEDSLGLFEEGVSHLRAARALLRTAELRIERVLEGADGEVVRDEPGAGGEEG